MSLKVYEIMQLLSVDQLSNLSMSEDGAGTIREKDQPKIINGINSAMKRLTTRFVIQEKLINVLLTKGQLSYPLRVEHTFSYYAENPLTPGAPYIYDVGDGVYSKFEGDILQIIAMKDNCGNVVHFNDPLKRYSVSMPTVDRLVLPLEMVDKTGDSIQITYKSKYKPIPINDPLEQILEMDVAFPDVLQEPLLALIASMVYGSMNGQEHILLSQSYLNTYESFCNELSLTDVVNESTSSIGAKFQQNGFC